MFNKKYYIRFGKLPEDGISKIYKHDILSCFEKGISVYDACKINNKWHVVLPIKINEDTIDTYKYFRHYSNRNVYLVTGKEIGIGNDGEPLLKNVKILKDITATY